MANAAVSRVGRVLLERTEDSGRPVTGILSLDDTACCKVLPLHNIYDPTKLSLAVHLSLHDFHC